MKLQTQWDAAGQYFLDNVELGTKGSGHPSGTQDFVGPQDDLPPEEDEQWDNEVPQAWDGVPGQELCPRKVGEARREDVEYYKATGVYTKVPIE